MSRLGNPHDVNRRIAVITSTVHRRHDGRVHAYEPYVREMNLWFENFESVTVCAPLVDETPSDNFIPYARQDITYEALPALGGHTPAHKLRVLANVPRILPALWRVMKGAAQIHLRMPGNMGLLGLLLCPFRPEPKIVKYANQWTDFPGESRSQRIQKFLLSRPVMVPRGTVLVYGHGGREAPHIKPFFTASYTQSEIDAVSDRVSLKALVPGNTVHLAVVGRMTAYKGGGLAIEVLKKLLDRGVPSHLHVVGDGPALPEMRHLAETLGVTSGITFYGNVDKARVTAVLLDAHIMLMLSQTEGWPKVITEGMIMGAVPVATGVSCVPWMLDNGRRGLVIERNAEAACQAIAMLAADPERLNAAKTRAHEWALQYTLDRFKTEIRTLCMPPAGN